MMKLSSISWFRIKSMFSVFTAKKGNPNPFIILSSTFHTSNQPSLKRSDLVYAFDCIDNIVEAVSLFDYMLQMKPFPSIRDFDKLLNIIARMEYYSQVVYLFKKFSIFGCPDEFMMSTLINCYCHMKEVELSFAIIASFLKRGYAPNVVSFTCMIKGFFLIGNGFEGVGLFKKLIRDRLCEVNEVTISTVLDGLSKSGNVVDAVELLLMSEKKNWKLDVVCYNAVMDGLCKGRMIKDGMGLLFRMIDRDVHPNVVTYNIFLHGLCNQGKLDFAYSVFSDLPSKGIRPNVITYTVMIQGLCRKGLFQDAKEMVEKMERLGCFPNSVTYNVIMQGCLHHRDSLDSISLLKQIVIRDFQLDAPSFFVLLGQMQVLRQMSGIYDDVVVTHMIQKLVFSDPTLLMRDHNVEFMISSLIQKLLSSDIIE